MEAVFKREFKSYFVNMSGYVFIGVMLLFCGIFTMAINLISHSAQFEYVLGNETIVLMLIIPVLTMRSMAEDRRTKTDQLLFSLPVSTAAVVVGKFLAMIAVYAVTCAAMGIVPLILKIFGSVPLGAAYAALFGFFLLGCSLIAICMFLSSLTSSQIIAAVLGIGATLALYLMSGLASLLPSTASGSLIGLLVIGAVLGAIVFAMTRNYLIAAISAAVCIIPTAVVYIVDSTLFEGLLPKIVGYLAVFDRFVTFSNGVFDLTALVYFLTVTVFFVFLSVQSMDKRRWS